MQVPKTNILHRLKITKGHLEKVIKMIEADEYCINIFHQLLAIQSALNNVDEIVLEKNL
jgi:DNA-binding FrmR family transcriptional regulator